MKTESKKIFQEALEYGKACSLPKDQKEYEYLLGAFIGKNLAALPFAMRERAIITIHKKHGYSGLLYANRAEYVKHLRSIVTDFKRMLRLSLVKKSASGMKSGQEILQIATPTFHKQGSSCR